MSQNDLYHVEKNLHFQAKSFYYENNYIANVILAGDVFAEDYSFVHTSGEVVSLVDESPEGNTASPGSEGMNLGTMMITFVPLSFDLHRVTCQGLLHRDSTPSFSHCCQCHFLKLIL